MLEEIIVENFPKMRKEIATQVQETQRVPNRISPRQNIPRHILIKLTKIKHKEQILKGAREKQQIIINIYAPNIGAPQYVRQMLTSIKGEINSNTIIMGDFSTPLTLMDKSTKQKINKETQVLNDTMDQLDLIDIYTACHPKWISPFS